MRRTSNIMRRFISLAIISIVFVCSIGVDLGGHSAKAVPVADDCDWPMFGRTPEGNRVVPDGCGPKTDNLELKWKYSKEVPDISETFLEFYKDKVYFTDNGIMYCYSIDSFKKIWLFEGSLGSSEFFRIRNDKLYFKSGDFLYCINATTGKLLWVQNIDFYDCMLFANENIYFQSSYFEDDKPQYMLYCISENNGKILHIYDLFERITKGIYIGNNIICFESDKYFYSISENSGDIIWKCDMILNKYNRESISDDKVIMSNIEDKLSLFCFDLMSGEVVWIYNSLYNTKDKYEIYNLIIGISNNKFYFIDPGDVYSIICLNLVNGELIWKFDFSNSYSIEYTSIINNSIIGINFPKEVFCLSLEKGNLLWSNDFKELDDVFEYIDPQSRLFFNDGFLFISFQKAGQVCVTHKDGKVLWKNNSGSFTSRVAFESKKSIIFAEDNGSTWENCFYTCLSKSTGKILWRTSLIYQGFLEKIKGSNENIFIKSRSGNLKCCSFETGKLLWEKEIGSSFTRPASICNDKVIVVSNDGYVNCLSQDNKKIIWRFKTDSEVWSTPTIFKGKVFISSFKGKFYCLSIDNGKKLWEFSLNSYIISSSIALDNKIYLGIDTGIYCFDINSGKTIWHYKMGSQTRDVVIYEFDSDSLSYWNGNLYLSLTSGKVVCLSASTGKTIWEFESGESKWHTQVPVISNGKVYCIFDKLYCLSADKGKLLWSYKDEKIERMFSPVSFKGNVIFCTSSGEIACLNEENVKLKWITKFENEEALIPPIISNNIVFSGAVKNNYLFGLSIADGKEVWKSDTIHNLTFSLSISKNNLFIGSVDGSFYCFGE